MCPPVSRAGKVDLKSTCSRVGRVFGFLAAARGRRGRGRSGNPSSKTKPCAATTRAVHLGGRPTDETRSMPSARWLTHAISAKLVAAMTVCLSHETHQQLTARFGFAFKPGSPFSLAHEVQNGGSYMLTPTQCMNNCTKKQMFPTAPLEKTPSHRLVCAIILPRNSLAHVQISSYKSSTLRQNMFWTQANRANNSNPPLLQLLRPIPPPMLSTHYVQCNAFSAARQTKPFIANWRRRKLRPFGTSHCQA